jgi:hypothetical protein
MLGDFTDAVAHFETMREMRTVLHGPTPASRWKYFNGQCQARRIFWTRGEDALGGANALHDLERDPTVTIETDQEPAATALLPNCP